MNTAKDIEMTHNEMSNDRRQFQRFKLDIPLRVDIVTARCDKTTLHYKADDISAEGAFIKTECVLPIGTIVSVEIDLFFSDIQCSEISFLRSDCMIMATGWISQLRDDGMVIRFKGEYRLVNISGATSKATIQ
jgi:hypothetical protein